MSSRTGIKLGRAFAIATIAAVAIFPASSAFASGSAADESAANGPGFGAHVAGCAQGAGFSGAHNPGMHQGASNWDLMRMPMSN